MRELHLNGRQFTWGNNHVDPTFKKLDRILICPDWEDEYPLTYVNALERELSDHTPLIIDTGTPSKKPPIFRFENAWFEREGLRDIVEKIWKKDNIRGENIDRWQERFRLLRKNLKGWNRNIDAEYRKLKTGILRQLDDIDKECAKKWVDSYHERGTKRA